MLLLLVFAQELSAARHRRRRKDGRPASVLLQPYDGCYFLLLACHFFPTTTTKKFVKSTHTPPPPTQAHYIRTYSTHPCRRRRQCKNRMGGEEGAGRSDTKRSEISFAFRRALDERTPPSTSACFHLLNKTFSWVHIGQAGQGSTGDRGSWANLTAGTV
ncbi:hypothetical protein LX32DRAFT_136861 [Colletotrichum zoysiae]|uniref:Uncharacterized protein n=1 Tax=Colletotrichum zoysiae TaxID=1216348 RepID=A0AAD9LZC0_9PEZI|nr:hypothetical protein LX32DRAFT_136861 [Colletotrichum zoysiae]